MEEVIQREKDLVYRLAFSQCHQKDQADDIFQNVMYRYMKRKPVFESLEHEKAWFIRVTLNCSKTSLKSFWHNKVDEIDEQTYIFEGKTLLSDFYKVLKMDGVEFDSIAGEADTLAGLLLEIKGEFPKLHEKLIFKNYSFEVLEMDARRILKIKLVILKDDASGENTGKANNA